MKSKRAFLFSALTAASLFSGCSEAPDENPLEVNKKYTLESWPDENYIAELDSILKAEPLKPDADKEKTALTIYSGAMPTIKLPGEKKAPIQKPSEKQTAETGQGKASATQKAERFADRFMNALSELQSDPSNTAKYRTVSAKAGENLFALLSRAYGNDATKLPKFYTLSALQSVNPNVRLEHLEAGDNVRLPVLGR